ncbi:MAG: diguanylate cyclase [Deltaproteobacteria bacterium]|nr:diguanylate cyclase [Deltaproteobacteria bacterium]
MLVERATVGPFIQRRLGRRIAVIVGLCAGMSGLGGLWVVLDQTLRTERAITRRLVQTIAATVMASFASFDARHGHHPIEDVVSELSRFPEVERLEVFDGQGRIRWSTDPGRPGRLVDSRVLAVLSPTTNASTAESRALLTGQVQVVLPLRRTSTCLPCHTKSSDPIGGVYVAGSEPELLGDVAGYIKTAALTVALAALALTVLLMLLLNRAVVARIERLAAVMAAAEEGDYFVRADVTTHDEIGLVASTFNRLLAKITDLRVERIETQREMTAVKDELGLQQQLAYKSQLLEQANRGLSARLKELSFLNGLGRDLSSRLDLDYLLERFCARITEGLAVPEVAVLLFERGEGRLRALKTSGLDLNQSVKDTPFDLDRGLSGQVVREKRAIYVPDMGSDERALEYRLEERLSGSVFVVPLIYQGEAIGVLGYSSPVVNAFPEEERELLLTVASQGALALANAQLFQETLELSLTDGLTGILNRRALESRMELEWSRSQRDQSPVSLVMVDIDHFKVYNDSQGHQAGDEALRRVARILERSLRKVDAVARYGGEEFAVILPRTGKAEAIEVARKLRRSVEQADFPRAYLQPLGRITISCGVATAPDDAQHLEELVKKADLALLSAKQGGRNRVFAIEAGVAAEQDQTGRQLPAVGPLPTPAAPKLEEPYE